MWVRSYERWDEASGHCGPSLAVSAESVEGRTILIASHQDGDTGWPPAIDSQPIDASTRFPDQCVGDDCLSPIGLWAQFSPAATILVLPYWLLTLASGWLAILFRLRQPWRFDRRDLCAGVALSAVVLGTSARLDEAWIGQAAASVNGVDGVREISGDRSRSPSASSDGSSEDCRPFVPCQ